MSTPTDRELMGDEIRLDAERDTGYEMGYRDGLLEKHRTSPPSAPQITPEQARAVCNYITDGICFHDPVLTVAYKTLSRIASQEGQK